MANRKKIVFDNRKESSVDSWKEIENANNFKLQARRKMFDSNNQRKGVITCKFKVPQYAIAKVEAKTDSSSG